MSPYSTISDGRYCLDLPLPISPLHRSTPPTRADAGAFSCFFVPPFNPLVLIHTAAPTQAPELALCFTTQLAPVVAGEGATSSVVELSYHHIDHDRNPLPHGKHRVDVSAYFGIAQQPAAGTHEQATAGGRRRCFDQAEGGDDKACNSGEGKARQGAVLRPRRWLAAADDSAAVAEE